MNMDAIIDRIAIRSSAKEEAGDYRKDGLLYCGRCKTPKQCRLEIGGKIRVVGCMCACQSRNYAAEERAEKAQQDRIRVRQLRSEGIQDRQLERCVFEAAEETENIRRCKQYVKHWEEVRKENAGLLFYGEPDGGKTFAAACIANALIERGVSVMLTSLPRIINAGWDKSEIISQLHRYTMMVLDDLGVERESGYAMETVYTVVDERKKSGLPLIVTTNLSLQELKNPKTTDHRRIYSRVLEMCVPVYFPGKGYRKKAAAHKLSLAREIFGGT